MIDTKVVGFVDRGAVCRGHAHRPVAVAYRWLVEALLELLGFECREMEGAGRQARSPAISMLLRVGDEGRLTLEIP